MTAIAAGGRPDESAKIVFRSRLKTMAFNIGQEDCAARSRHPLVQ
ncbi:MAG TPA: hypothetical protein VGL31_16425 [Xanthobacteraceae bacterium]